MAIDIIFAGLMVWGVYKGFSQGLIRSVFSFAAFFIALLAAFKLGHLVSGLLREWIADSTILPLLSFIIILIGAILLMKLVVNLIEGTLKFTQLNIFNRLAGIILWCGLFLLLFVLLLWLFDKAGLITANLKSESITYAPVVSLSPVMNDIFRGFFSFLDFLSEFMKKIF